MQQLRTLSGITLALALLGTAHPARADGQSWYRCWTTVQLGIDTSPAASMQQAIALYAEWAGVRQHTVTCVKTNRD
ncbi:hypothetical protein [Herbaspirillum autotrophicum]|uniref:hypothetical protein n=1 Tax=Herbaspirillum autotrophicum TaxID=180195 RepID=UPI00067D3D01|nr:hypothetical protein [Herbaspirillum autotrophicum]